VDVGIRKIIALSVGALSLTALAACGSLQTAAVSSTPNAAQATATALFVGTNVHLAAVNEPTLAPGTDPIHPFANITYPPEPTITPGPSPTPVAPSCGATIAGWPDILATYGGFYKGNACAAFTTDTGTQLVIATAGIDNGAGAIATYHCEATDSSCLAGDAPTAAGAAWSVYPSPYRDVIEIFRFAPPSTILLLPGEYCFDLDTDAYDLNSSCWTSAQ
jgi:hypothetical protein